MIQTLFMSLSSIYCLYTFMGSLHRDLPWQSLLSLNVTQILAGPSE
jgi:hypothetical protein